MSPALMLAMLMLALSAAGQSSDELVAWNPSPYQETGSDPSETKRRLGALREKVLAVEREIRETGRYRFLSVEDAIVDSAEHVGHPVAVVATANSVYVAGRSECTLQGAGLMLMASLKLFSVDLKRALLETQAHGPYRVLVFQGVLRSTSPRDPGSAPYLEAHGFRDLGPLPPQAGSSLHGIHRLRERPSPSELRSAIAVARRRVQGLSAETDWPQVRIEALAKDPAPFLGRPLTVVALTGVYMLLPGGVAVTMAEELFSPKGFIQALLPPRSKPEVKELVSGDSLFHVGLARGHVRLNSGGTYYLEASSYEDLCGHCSLEDVRDPDKPLPEVVPPLESEPGRLEYERLMAELKVSADAALARATRDRRRQAIDFEDLLLAPESHVGRSVAVLGTMSEPEDGQAGRFAQLGYPYGGALGIATLLARVSLARLAASAPWPRFSLRPVVVAGTLRSEGGVVFLDAEDLEVVGEFPWRNSEPPYRIATFQRGDGRISFETVSARARAEIERARSDPNYRYVRFEDLLLAPAQLIDKRVSLAGVPHDFQAGGGRHHFHFGTRSWGQDALRAVMDHLPLAEQKRVLRLSHPLRLALLRGRLLRTLEGTYYFETDSLTDLGEHSGLLELNAIR